MIGEDNANGPSKKAFPGQDRLIWGLLVQAFLTMGMTSLLVVQYASLDPSRQCIRGLAPKAALHLFLWAAFACWVLLLMGTMLFWRRPTRGTHYLWVNLLVPMLLVFSLWFYSPAEYPACSWMPPKIIPKFDQTGYEAPVRSSGIEAPASQR